MSCSNGVEFRHTSDFVEVPAGARTLAVRKSGNSAVLRSLETSPSAEGGRYSIVAGGVVLSVAPVSALARHGFGEDRPGQPADHQRRQHARFRRHGAAGPARRAYHRAGCLADGTYAAAVARRTLFAATARCSISTRGTWVVRFTRAGTTDVVAASESTAIGVGAGEGVHAREAGGRGLRLTVVAE